MIKKGIQLAGTALMLASLWYVGDRLAREGTQLSNIDVGWPLLLIMLGAVCLYAGSNTLLSRNWLVLLKGLGLNLKHDRDFQWIFAKTQLAKYIPGNIAHIAGRHVLAKLAGGNHAQLTLSVFYEMAGLSIAAVCVALLAVGDLHEIIGTELPTQLAWLLVPVGVLTYLNIHKMAVLLPLKESSLAALSLQPAPLALFGVLFRYCLFFGIGGVVFLIICQYVSGPLTAKQMLVIAASFPISWVVGFYTPGAPSGIGVREAVIITILGTGLGLPEAAVIAILLRVVTVLGDASFTAFGWFRYAQRAG